MSQPKAYAIDFAPLIKERTSNFIGRDWAFGKIDAWLGQKDAGRVFLLTGEPGSGKTAIAARLAQFSAGEAGPPAGLQRFGPDFLHAIHFCSATASDWTDPRTFARSISLQLAAIPEFALALKDIGDKEINISVQQEIGDVADGATVTGVLIKSLVIQGLNGQEAFNRIVLDPLRTIYNAGYDQPIVILVDSLDEALTSATDVTIVDLLAGLQGLNARVRLILTSRAESRVENRFFGASGLFLSDPAYTADNDRDILEYVTHRLTSDDRLKSKVAALPPAQAAALPNQITGKAEGNFLYGVFLLNAAAEGQQALNVLDRLPSGLDGLYYSFLERIVKLGKKDWSTVYKPVLGVLSVAQESITLAQVQAYTGLPGDAWDVLLDLRQFVETSPAPSSMNDDEESEDRYRLYHQSVGDFLRRRQIVTVVDGQKKRYDNVYCVVTEDWHKRIVATYRGEASVWEEVEWSRCDDYGLRALASHLFQLGTTRAAAEDLVRLICKPYVQEKQARVLQASDETWESPRNYQTVLGDIDLALRRALEHDDPLQIVRLTLTHVFLQATAETRGQFGAVALAASQGDFRRALRDAQLIGNPETRFLQLLLIAESMLDHDKTDQGLRVLNDALDLTVRSQIVSRAGVDDLGIRLITRHRAVELAGRLAQKTGRKLDKWVAPAAMAVLEIDPIFAAHLLSYIGDTYRWYETALDLARRTAAAQPAAARQVLDAIIVRARAENNPYRVLDAVRILRTLDEPAARQGVETVIDDTRSALQAGAPNQPRETARIFNRAVAEYAAFDLEQALTLAINECPDVVDSSETRTSTLTRILERGMDTDHRIDSSLLRAIGEPRDSIPIGQNLLDEAWSALARAFVAAGMGEEGWALYDHIISPACRVLTAIVLHTRYPRSGTVEQAIADLGQIDQYASLDGIGATLADFCARQPELTRKALAAIGCSLSKVRVLVSVLQFQSSLDPDLLRECQTCIDILPTEDQPEITLALARAIVEKSPDTATALLERTLSILTSIDPKARRDDILHDVASCAIKQGVIPLANRAMDQWAKAAAERGRGDEASLVELGSFAVANRMTLNRSTIVRLLDGIQNPYFVGRLLVGLPGMAEETMSRWSRSQTLPGPVAGTLATIAACHRSTEGIRRLLGYEYDTVNRAFLEVLLATTVEDRLTARMMLDRVWSDLQNPSPELQARGHVGDDERLDSVRVDALVALARIDLQSARVRLRDLAPWHRHEVYRGLADLAEYRDEDAQTELFREALASADEADDNPTNCLIATLNVARAHLSLSQEIRQAAANQALRHIARIRDEDDRAVAYMMLVAQSELLTSSQLSQTWRKLRQALTKARWTLPATDDILSAARTVQDPANAVRLWKEIVLARLQDMEFPWSMLDVLGPAILELVKLGEVEYASAILALDLKEVKGISHEPWPDDIILIDAAYVVCAQGHIDPQGATELVTRFVRHLHQVAPKHASYLHSLLTDVVRVLLDHYPDTSAVMAVWDDLVDLCLRLPALDDRSHGLLALVDRALEASDIDRALLVARHVPLQRDRANAVSAIVQALGANDDKTWRNGLVAAWQATFAMASTNSDALSECAAAWCQTYLEVESRAGRLVVAWQEVFEQIDLAYAVASG